jgi:CSLREA domain-containing protein
LVIAPAASADTFTVTKLDDTNGSACTVGDTDCSLREAINAADFNANGGTDVINFASGLTGTIELAPDNFNELKIRNESLDIQGPGADVLTISGGNANRIFKIFGFDAPGGEVTISGLTMTEGDGNTFSCCTTGDGGAILNADFIPGPGSDSGPPAHLTVANSVITDSVADAGGGIANEAFDSSSAGELTIVDTTIDGNEAEVGGGIYTAEVNAPVTVERSTISNNNALEPQEVRAGSSLQSGDGGGMAVDDSTQFSSRSSDGADVSSGDVLVENSTFTSNHADGAGGGIRFLSNPSDTSRTVQNSTVAGNSAAEGGGISVSRRLEVEQEPRGVTVAPPIDLSSTIVADNTADGTVDNSDGPDLQSDNSSFSAGHSLLEVTTGATVTDTPAGSNITGQDPQLGVLADNGGPTQTKLPATTSPAIDAGTANSLAVEQRGTGRTLNRPPANATDGTDVGAVELPADENTVPGPRTVRCLGETMLVKRGSSTGEKLEGTPDRDGIFAHAGKDTVLGLASDDCLFGGTDEDNLKGGPGDDRANGDPDDDTVHGNGGRDDIRGQHGNDKVFGGAGNDRRVAGGTGDDDVNGGAGDDGLIKGDGGNDDIDPGSGNDFVHAGGGRDVIHAADGDVDEIICGTGHDVAYVDSGDSVLPDCNEVHVVH